MHLVYHFPIQPLSNPTMSRVANLISTYFTHTNYNEATAVVVAQSNGKLIGACLIKESHDKSHIMKLCTHHDFRKRGVATRLIEYVTTEFKGPLALHVDRNFRHDDLVSFYKRRNFKVHSESDKDTEMQYDLISCKEKER